MQHHCESCNSSHPACNFHLTHLAWAALWVSNEFGRVPESDHEFGGGGGHCFAWRVPSFLATHRPTAPPPLLVSEHGDFTLLLCKPCFSVSVCDTHVRRGHQRHTKRDGPLFVILQMSNYCWITQSPQSVKRDVTQEYVFHLLVFLIVYMPHFALKKSLVQEWIKTRNHSSMKHYICVCCKIFYK